MFDGGVTVAGASCIRGCVMTAYNPVTGDIIHQKSIFF